MFFVCTHGFVGALRVLCGLVRELECYHRLGEKKSFLVLRPVPHIIIGHAVTVAHLRRDKYVVDV